MIVVGDYDGDFGIHGFNVNLFFLFANRAIFGTCTINDNVLKIGVCLVYHTFDGSAQPVGVVAVDGYYG